MPTVLEAQRDMDMSAVVMTPREAIASTPWLGACQTPRLTSSPISRCCIACRPAAPCSSRRKHPPSPCCSSSGSVELLAVRGTEETLVEFVRAPDLLLPAAVLNRQPYLLRARVLDEARLVMIQAEAFRTAVASDHDLCLAVLACQAAQFRRQIKHAKNLQLRSAEERVGCYLLAFDHGCPARPAGQASAGEAPHCLATRDDA